MVSINDRIRIYIQDWLEHVEMLVEGRSLKQGLRYKTKGKRDPG
jgi:hypothetical protein